MTQHARRAGPAGVQWVVLALALSIAMGCTFDLTITGSDRWVEEAIDSGAVEGAVDFGSPLLAQRCIVVNRNINAVSARQVVSQLLYLDRLAQGEPINLYLNSRGGGMSDALAIIETMRSLGSPVNTHAMADCQSAGALVLAAGTGQRTAYPSSVIVIHGARQTSGPALARYTQLMNSVYHGLWRDIARLPEEWFPMAPDRYHVLSAEDALRLRVVDRIAPGLASSHRDEPK